MAIDGTRNPPWMGNVLSGRNIAKYYKDKSDLGGFLFLISWREGVTSDHVSPEPGRSHWGHSNPDRGRPGRSVVWAGNTTPQLGEDRESCALTGGQALQEVKEGPPGVGRGVVVRIDESK